MHFELDNDTSTIEYTSVNEQGESKISVADYAHAMLDEAQNAAHINQRISVAY